MLEYYDTELVGSHAAVIVASTIFFNVYTGAQTDVSYLIYYGVGRKYVNATSYVFNEVLTVNIW